MVSICHRKFLPCSSFLKYYNVGERLHYSLDLFTCVFHDIVWKNLNEIFGHSNSILCQQSSPLVEDCKNNSSPNIFLVSPDLQEIHTLFLVYSQYPQCIGHTLSYQLSCLHKIIKFKMLANANALHIRWGQVGSENNVKYSYYLTLPSVGGHRPKLILIISFFNPSFHIPLSL